MRVLIILFVLMFLISLSACGETFAEMDERGRVNAETACRMDWSGSGYDHRIISFKLGDDPQFSTHVCQVKIGDRWVPANNVKVGG